MIANDFLQRDALFILNSEYNSGIMYLDEGMLPDDAEMQKIALEKLLRRMNAIVVIGVAFADGFGQGREVLGRNVDSCVVVTCEDSLVTQLLVYEITDDALIYIRDFQGSDTLYSDVPYIHLLRKPFSLS